MQRPISIDVHEIDRGDRLPWQATTIDRIEYDPREGWLLLDDRGTVLTVRPLGARVQVYRGHLTSHDCPPAGQPRPLELVR